MKLLKLFVITLLFVSCNKEPLDTTTKKITNAKNNAAAPFLFKTKNNILLSWTEIKKDKTKNQLKYAPFDHTNHKFGNDILVSPATGLQFHAESMAKVGMTEKGITYAVYRRKSKNSKSRFGGHIYYCTSTDNGKNWGKEKKLVIDSTSTSQAFFDLARLPDGELGLIWLDSRKPIAKERIGKTIYFARTTNNNEFTNEKAIIGGTCECCRTELYIDNKKNIHVAYRNQIHKENIDFDDNGDVEIRDMYYSISKDNGKTFSDPIVISQDNWHINGCPHTGPTLAENSNKLAVVWFTAANDYAGIFYSEKEKANFKKRILISKNGRHPQMIAISSSFYIVYEEYYEKNEKGYTKIVLKKITNNKTEEVEISKPLTNNEHPVIVKINSDYLGIVWTNTDTRNSKVFFKLHKIN